MEEYTFLIWVRRLGDCLLALEVVGDGKLEDWAKEGFLVASVKETIEEGVDLVIDDSRFGIKAVKPVDHSEDKAAEHAGRMGRVRGQVHVQIERFLVESVRHSAISYRELEVKEDCGAGALGDFPA